MLHALNCPNCGAALPLPLSGEDLITCQYCNTSFHAPKTLTPEPGLGDLILGADFSRKPIVGWSFPSEDKVRLAPNQPPELHAKFPASDTLYYALNSAGYFDDLDASVSFRFQSGNEKFIRAGLILRYQKGVGSYGALVSAQGTYMIGYYEKGPQDDLVWKIILDWTTHSALRAGFNQVNRLRVIVSGDHLRFYLNGVLATSLRDQRYTLGEVLLAAEPGAQMDVEVSFFDLQLREVPKE